jgi:hypothetical protein
MNTEMKLSRDLKKVEKRLQKVLQPIKPPAVFVTDLRERLDQEMAKKVKTRKARNRILVAGGVLGVVALLIAIIRKLASLEKVADSFSKQVSRFRKPEQAASI